MNKLMCSGKTATLITIRLLTLSLALLGVATLPAAGLLQVVGLGSTPTAQGVRLVATLTKG